MATKPMELSNLCYISKGSFALVYAAQLEPSGTRVAVKVTV